MINQTRGIPPLSYPSHVVRGEWMGERAHDAQTTRETFSARQMRAEYDARTAWMIATNSPEWM